MAKGLPIRNSAKTSTYKNPDAELPQRAIEGWMASPPHRDNLLSADFRESGIGVAQGADGETYVTQDFIRLSARFDWL
jgi:uncharacterized protein YkwD